RRAERPRPQFDPAFAHGSSPASGRDASRLAWSASAHARNLPPDHSCILSHSPRLPLPLCAFNREDVQGTKILYRVPAVLHWRRGLTSARGHKRRLVAAALFASGRVSLLRLIRSLERGITNHR